MLTIDLHAASIHTTAEATLVAGRDLNINAITTQDSVSYQYDDHNHLRETTNDIQLAGAVAKANQVTADIGGNLQIDSLQDTSTYRSKQQSNGVGVTIPVGTGAAGMNVDVSRSHVNSDYTSVTEQSGIKAGDDGFVVQVQGNTDLQGGVITSTDHAVKAEKNRFETASLTHSDIENRADYDGKSIGVSTGIGTQPDASQGTGVGFGTEGDSAHSTTRSGISGIAGNTEVRTGDAETGIAPIFDQRKVEQSLNAQTQITLALSQQAPKAIGTFADQQMRSSDPTEAAKWAEGGAYRVALHAIAGAMSGGVGGALGAGGTVRCGPMGVTFTPQTGHDYDTRMNISTNSCSIVVRELIPDTETHAQARPISTFFANPCDDSF